ncbi:pyridoxal phosphate-dependent decarboxylase family protein [Sandaracinobacteroides saxicola]|uniref:Aspartate aminotransferase family protein n=1 Tax=Sandaracinobacteroides saxicola TaxID=2759707 RepID=A0A7G5IFK7_9SPHN|nr:aspartate aminotransferase family protein [Sandaracinobacteroides saxicola]QMW22149.1 aspartate aminotransferase family protein [Sandaracinobacteroides saxicola]
MRIPATGRSEAEIMAALEEYGVHDLPWREGGTFAYVYEGGRDVEAVVKAAYMRYLTENALDPTVYPSLLRFETEIVAMAVDHLRGDADCVGNFTSGGTESCILAVKAARDHARAVRGIAEPEIVLPVTAHACFQKAAHYLDMPMRLVPVDADTFKVRAEDMAAAMNESTALIVGSACQYAHGVVDPIPELGALALERQVLLHVDGCIGGFILPYFRRLGAAVTDFDFAVPGVTSISMDFHKYGYAAKGASVVLYRSKELRRHQIFTAATWTGYSVINPTIQSTKSGGPLAACWAVLNYLGDEGYMRFAERTLAATRRIADAVRATPGVRLMAEPESCLVAFTSDEFSIFPIVDAMRRRGWFVQPQLGYMGSRENIHLSIDQSTIDVVERFLPDLRASIEEARGSNEAAIPAPMKALLGSLSADSFTPETYRQLMAAAGTSEGLPEGTTAINEMLNAMQPEVAAKVMTEFFNDLYVSPKAA